MKKMKLKDGIQEDHTLHAAVEALRQKASKEESKAAPKGKKANKTLKVEAIKAEAAPKGKPSTVWTILGAIIGVAVVLFVLFGGNKSKKLTSILQKMLGRNINFRIAFGAIGFHGAFNPQKKNWHIYGGRKTTR